MSAAVPAPITREPRHKTFASLCWRANRALSASLHTTALTDGWRFAAIDIPTPVPQTKIASCTSPVAMARLTACAKSG